MNSSEMPLLQVISISWTRKRKRSVTYVIPQVSSASIIFLISAYEWGDQTSPSLSHLPIDSVQSVYSSQLTWLGGTDGAEILSQISALAGI